MGSNGLIKSNSSDYPGAQESLSFAIWTGNCLFTLVLEEETWRSDSPSTPQMRMGDGPGWASVSQFYRTPFWEIDCGCLNLMNYLLTWKDTWQSWGHTLSPFAADRRHASINTTQVVLRSSEEGYRPFLFSLYFSSSLKGHLFSLMPQLLSNQSVNIDKMLMQLVKSNRLRTWICVVG